MITPKLTYSGKWAFSNNAEAGKLLIEKIGVKVGTTSVAPTFYSVTVNGGKFDDVHWLETEPEALAFAKELRAKEAKSCISVGAVKGRIYTERKKPSVWIPSWVSGDATTIGWFPGQEDSDD